MLSCQAFQSESSVIVEAGFVVAYVLCQCAALLPLYGSQRDSIEALVCQINEIRTNCTESCRPLVSQEAALRPDRNVRTSSCALTRLFSTFIIS